MAHYLFIFHIDSSIRIDYTQIIRGFSPSLFLKPCYIIAAAPDARIFFMYCSKLRAAAPDMWHSTKFLNTSSFCMHPKSNKFLFQLCSTFRIAIATNKFLAFYINRCMVLRAHIPFKTLNLSCVNFLR